VRALFCHRTSERPATDSSPFLSETSRSPSLSHPLDMVRTPPWGGVMTADQRSFDDLGDRQCRRCNTIKPLQEFSASLRANGTVKFGSYCPPCRKAYQHEWYLAHRPPRGREGEAPARATTVGKTAVA